MKKINTLTIKTFAISITIIYAILCIFLMEKPPFNIILPICLIFLFLLYGILAILGIFIAAKNNMIMFHKNCEYENEKSMFFFDQIFGTCYQIIKDSDKYYFIKIGNGHFKIKATRIYRNLAQPDQCLKNNRVKIFHKNQVHAVIVEGMEAFDIATYKYDRLLHFHTPSHQYKLQSVFNKDAEEILHFFEIIKEKKQPISDYNHNFYAK